MRPSHAQQNMEQGTVQLLFSFFQTGLLKRYILQPFETCCFFNSKIHGNHHIEVAMFRCIMHPCQRPEWPTSAKVANQAFAELRVRGAARQFPPLVAHAAVREHHERTGKSCKGTSAQGAAVVDFTICIKQDKLSMSRCFDCLLHAVASRAWLREVFSSVSPAWCAAVLGH